jgi:transcriptional regulator with XRE-family HTH domain
MILSMEWQDLRAARRNAALTLRDVARAAGTSETNVSAYERGVKRPSRLTMERLEAVLATEAGSPLFRHNLLTVPAAAAMIRSALRDGWPTVDVLRIVRELVSNVSELDADADYAAFFAVPSTTGDPRWDAMLAGVTEDAALRAGRTPPPWTVGHALDRFWFVGSLPGMNAWVLAHSRPSLRVRGVIVDPDSLQSV